MNYLRHELGVVEAGSVAVIELEGTEANVLLLNATNFRSYARGGRYQYYGGHYTNSPVRIAVPTTDEWFVVVDLGGYAGRVSTAVHVVPA